MSRAKGRRESRTQTEVQYSIKTELCPTCGPYPVAEGHEHTNPITGKLVPRGDEEEKRRAY